MIEAVTTYTELIAGIEAARIELGIKQRDFDDLIGFAAGSWGKAAGLLGIRQLRLEYAFAAVRGAGLRLRLEVDPEQLAKMKARIADNYNPRQANQARNGNSASPVSAQALSRVFKHLSRKGNEKRWKKTTPQERSDHMRMMAMAGVRKRRKEMKRRARQRKRAHEARKEAAAAHATA